MVRSCLLVLIAFFWTHFAFAEGLSCIGFIYNQSNTIALKGAYPLVGGAIFAPETGVIQRFSLSHTMPPVKRAVLDFIAKGENQTVLGTDLRGHMAGMGHSRNMGATYLKINSDLRHIFGFDVIRVANDRYFIDRASFETDPRKVIVVEHMHEGKPATTPTLKADWSFHIYGDVFFNPSLGMIRKGNKAVPLGHNYATLLLAILEAPGRWASRDEVIGKFKKNIPDAELKRYKSRANQALIGLLGFELISSSSSKDYFLDYGGLISPRLYVSVDLIPQHLGARIIELIPGVHYIPKLARVRYWKKSFIYLTAQENFLIASILAYAPRNLNEHILSGLLSGQGFKDVVVMDLVESINGKLSSRLSGNLIESDGIGFYIRKDLVPSLNSQKQVPSSQGIPAPSIARATNRKWTLSLGDKLKLSPSTLEVTDGRDVRTLTEKRYDVLESLIMAEGSRISRREIMEEHDFISESSVAKEIAEINKTLRFLSQESIFIGRVDLIEGDAIFYVAGVKRSVVNFRDITFIPSIPYIVVFDQVSGKYKPLFLKETSALSLLILDQLIQSGGRGVTFKYLRSLAKEDPYISVPLNFKGSVQEAINTFNEALRFASDAYLVAPDLIVFGADRVMLEKSLLITE